MVTTGYLSLKIQSGRGREGAISAKIITAMEFYPS